MTLLCPKCGYADSSWVKQYKLYTPMVHPSEIVVLDRKLKLKTLPTVKATCPKCMNREAECWAVTFGSEGTEHVSFFRCTSCGHTWREKD